MEEEVELIAHRDYPGYAAYGYDPKTGKAMALIGSIEWRGGRVMKGGGPRDVVKEFSAASKARLRKKIWGVPWTVWARASFLTLTYPEVYPDSKTAKIHLNSFWKRVLRSVGAGAWAIWALELQKRGAPHFHLLADWGARNYDDYLWRYEDLRYWISINWADVISPTNDEHYKASVVAGTRMEPIANIQTLKDYVSKPGSKIRYELTKDAQRPPAEHGRWWGVLNRNMYWTKTHIEKLDFGRSGSWKVWYEVQEKWAEEFKVPKEERENTHLPQWTEDSRYIQKTIKEHNDRSKR